MSTNNNKNKKMCSAWPAMQAARRIGQLRNQRGTVDLQAAEFKPASLLQLPAAKFWLS